MSFMQRILRICGPAEQPPPAAPPLPPLEREAPLAAPQPHPPLVRFEAAPSQPLPAPQPQPEPLVLVPAPQPQPQPQPLVPIPAPQPQPLPQPLRAPAPALVPPPPPPVEPLGIFLPYEGSSMKLLNDGIIAYMGKLKQDPAGFTRKCSSEPLEGVPITRKLEAAISRRAVKGNVTAQEAVANPANRVAKGVLKGEIQQYLESLSLELKNVEDENFKALSEEIELVRLWVVSFKKIWLGA